MVGEDDNLPRLRVFVMFELAGALLVVPLLLLGTIFEEVILLPGFRGGVVPDVECCHRPSNERPALPEVEDDSPP